MKVFDRLAERYHAEQGRNPFRTALVEQVAALLAAGGAVLGPGCGTGIPTAKILTESDHRVVGVDVLEGLLRLAREQVPTAEFVRATSPTCPTSTARSRPAPARVLTLSRRS